MIDYKVKGSELAANVVLPLTGYVRHGNPASLQRAEDMIAAALEAAHAAGREEALSAAVNAVMLNMSGTPLRHRDEVRNVILDAVRR